MNAVEVDRVTKVFRSGLLGPGLRALDGVAFRVREGEIVGLLGPNGSGKSTLLKIVLGLLAPSAGECRLFGMASTRPAARAEVGYLPEAPSFDPGATGFEAIRFHARLSGLPRPSRDERVERAIAGVGLVAAMHRRVGTYSQGMRQRLGLAQALVHEPRLVILDEPMAGLDPVGTAETGRLICNLKAAGRTVLFTSHLLAQVAEICDGIVLLNRGRVALEGRVEDLTRRTDRVALDVDAVPPEVLGELRDWLQMRGIRLHGVAAPRGGMERVFLEAVRGTSGRDPGAS